MYDHKKIDKKWQDKWAEAGIFNAKDSSKKKKFYCLIEFPYPSGAGLHVGHPRSYTALDVIARKRRMQGYNVLYPIGWDAFGLPTENFAIKTGRPPKEVTAENIATFKRQLKSLGFSFDWSREINTTDPQYYKWTQWQFIQFFKAGLAYKDQRPINWCLDCKIGLANEEVVDGVCERCGGEVEKRDKEQWMIAITKYADRLLEDLKNVDYLDKIKKQQIDWIGKSEGAEVVFQVADSKAAIEVFTTRPDTLFGATYMVLAPEHPLIEKLEARISNIEKVRQYIKTAQTKTDIERGDATKEKTGVELEGIKAINPVNGEEIPIWVADYVLMGYGTGAIMAVPAHDERDFEFATKFELPIVPVVLNGRTFDVEELVNGVEDLQRWRRNIIENGPWTGEGSLINSGQFDGQKSQHAGVNITKWLEKKGVGKAAVNYKLRDWVFSRQRYWGEPIPLVFCKNCAKQAEARNPKSEILNAGWIPVPDDQLPVELPEVEKYEPTDDGQSPLAAIDEWVKTTCPECGGDAERETDTMPNWAGSSWYFLRYCDAHNDKEFASKKALKYWMPIDWYNGGMEHTTLHLLYSRFWNKFLHDQGHVPVSEPYARRTSQGLILAEDGAKMSKSKGNVVNPDEIVNEFGADTLRIYELFMGPFTEPVPWSTQGVVGVRRFLDRVMRMTDFVGKKESPEVTRELHQTIRKVTDDIEGMRFNTAVSKMMEFVNVVYGTESITNESVVSFMKLLCPFAPHVANELAEAHGVKDFVESQAWPEYDEKLAAESEIEIAVQVNGKLRGSIMVAAGTGEKETVELAKKDENVAKYLENEPKKTIYVQSKLVNFVI